MKNLRKSIIILMAVIIVAIYVGKSKNKNSIAETPKTKTKIWRMPQGEELVDISQIIVENKIKVCGEYHVRLIQEGEYVIACSDDGTTWHYFVVYRYSKKIFKANYEIASELEPPR